MRKTTLAIGGSLILSLVAPSLAQAGWANRVSNDPAPAVPTERIARVAPLGENFKFPTKADRVQGMPPYQAFSGSPYAAPAAPPPIMDPANAPQDPVYFNTATGPNRF